MSNEELKQKAAGRYPTIQPASMLLPLRWHEYAEDLQNAFIAGHQAATSTASVGDEAVRLKEALNKVIDG